jgi:hypothetical protein
MAMSPKMLQFSKRFLNSHSQVVVLSSVSTCEIVAPRLLTFYSSELQNVRLARLKHIGRTFSTAESTDTSETSPSTDHSPSGIPSMRNRKPKRYFKPPPIPQSYIERLQRAEKQTPEDLQLEPDPELLDLGITDEQLDQLAAIVKTGKHPSKLGIPRTYFQRKGQVLPPTQLESPREFSPISDGSFYDPVLAHLTEEEIAARYSKMTPQELRDELERQYDLYAEHVKKLQEVNDAQLNKPLPRLPTKQEMDDLINGMFEMKMRGRLIYPTYSHEPIRKQLIEKMKILFRKWTDEQNEITLRRVYWALFSNMASIGAKVLKTEDERITILCPEAPFVGESVPFPQFPEIPVAHKRYFTSSKRPPPADVAISEEIDISANETKRFVDGLTAHAEKHVDVNNRPIRYAIAKDGGIHQLAIQYKFSSNNKIMEIRYRLCADDVERLGLFSSPLARISDDELRRMPMMGGLVTPNPPRAEEPRLPPINKFPYAKPSPKGSPSTSVDLAKLSSIAAALRRQKIIKDAYSRRG